MWKATCRACRWTVQSPDRQRAAFMFRVHHREMLKTPKNPVIVELRASEQPTGPHASTGLALDHGEITA